MSTYYYWGSAEDHRGGAKASIQIEDGHKVPEDEITAAFEGKVAKGLRGQFRLFFRTSGEIFAFQL